MPSKRFVLLATTLISLVMHKASGVADIQIDRDNETIRFATVSDTATYYILYRSQDLSIYTALAIDFASNTPIWEIDVTEVPEQREFYGIGPVSLFAPQDSDGDRIDDVYELLNPDILDPLNTFDANLDPDNNGKTHLQEYLERFDLGSAPQFYAREITIFNFGTPFGGQDAISREYTAFNFGSPSASMEAISRMLSVYKGSGAPLLAGYPVVWSREITAYNLGEPTALIEAISRELSVYNGSGPPLLAGIPIVWSREISTFNYGQPSASIEAISREISINALRPTE